MSGLLGVHGVPAGELEGDAHSLSKRRSSPGLDMAPGHGLDISPALCKTQPAPMAGACTPRAPE